MYLIILLAVETALSAAPFPDECLGDDEMCEIPYSFIKFSISLESYGGPLSDKKTFGIPKCENIDFKCFFDCQWNINRYNETRDLVPTDWHPM